jgi:hypothetical protein
MSELRVGLVAEGVTDKIIIEAALRAILGSSFVLTLLQPEATQPSFGQGWGGVLKWCDDFRESGFGAFEHDPRLANFDLVIVHLDADVADKAYADNGPAVAELAVTKGLMAMPFALPCPPATDTTTLVERLILSWLGVAACGTKAVFCIPSKSIEAWLAAALLPGERALLDNIECDMNVEGVLARLPIAKRVRKNGREYRAQAAAVTAAWGSSVRRLCMSAADFEHRVMAVLA